MASLHAPVFMSPGGAAGILGVQFAFRLQDAPVRRNMADPRSPLRLLLARPCTMHHPHLLRFALGALSREAPRCLPRSLINASMFCQKRALPLFPY